MKKRGEEEAWIEGDRRRSYKTRTALAPSLQTFIFREWICMMRARARSFGCGNSIFRSNRPDLIEGRGILRGGVDLCQAQPRREHL